jgi:hypothetical protein
MKRAYNGNQRAKQIALKLWKSERLSSRKLADKLLELGYVESISHVTCMRWIDEFKHL